NNGRYLTLMDLGRLDFMIRSGLGSVVLRRRWRPVVGSAGFRYRRPLEPFARFELHTRLSCWDSKWFYMEQSFQRAGAVYGAGVVKALFKSGRRKVMPSEVLEAMGVRIDSPPIPAGLIEWQLADSKLAARDRQRPRAAG
ncbi:MAG: thioesterase family protein, partial [Myxococcota bacterium]